jgi:hypothetical protein
MWQTYLYLFVVVGAPILGLLTIVAVPTITFMFREGGCIDRRRQRRLSS